MSGAYLTASRLLAAKLLRKLQTYVQAYSAESREYFDRVCELLTSFGVNFEVDKQLVRGLDYYAHTVFEVIHPGIGAQNAIAGGGRYELYLPQK